MTSRITMCKRIAASLSAVCLGLLLLHSASAHAKLERSDPAAGAKLTSAPAKITLLFSEEISAQATDSYFTVADAKGAKVGAGQLDSTDLDHKTLTGALNTGLGDGIYTVKWFAVTTDDNGHTDGEFSFGVNATPGAQPTAKPEPTEQPAAAPTSAAAGGAAATSGGAAPTNAALPSTGGTANDGRGILLLVIFVTVMLGVALRRGARRR